MNFLFQMQAMMNIEVLNAYEAKKIVIACPHCFNTLKNEYPFRIRSIWSCTSHNFLKSLLDDGRLTIGGQFKGKRITLFMILAIWSCQQCNTKQSWFNCKLDAELVEMKRSKANVFWLWSRRSLNVLKIQPETK
jgi:ribosomal protein L37AE/L43A